MMNARRAAGRAPRSAWGFAAGVLAIVVGGAVLRLYHLGYQSLWLDELGVATVALRPFGPMLEGVRGHAAAAPLDYVWVHLTTAVLGHGTTATRAWSWLCGVAGVGAVIWLAWEVFRSRPVAIAAGVLLALSPFHIAYSQEVRFYALSVLLGTVALATGIRAIRLGGRGSWLLFAGAVTACLYTHYFLIAVPLSLGAAMAIIGTGEALRDRERARFWLRRGAAFAGSVALAVVAFLPWYFFAVVSQAGRQYGFPTPNPLDLAGYDQALLALLAPSPYATAPAGEATIAARGVVLLAVVGVLTAKSTARLAAVALGLLALGLIPLAFVLDARSGYFFNARQIILVLVPLFVLAAGGAASLLGWATRLIAPAGMSRAAALGASWAVLGLATILMIDPSFDSVYSDGLIKEDWRRAANVVASSRCDSGRVFVNLGAGYSHGVGYYHPELLPVVVSVEVSSLDRDPMAIFDRIVASGLRPTDWVVLRPSFANGEQVATAIRALGSRGYRYDGSTHLAVITPPVTCAGNP